MKYIKIEKDDEIWYFTNKYKAAQYMGATQSNVNVSLKNGYKCRGWNVEEVEAEPIYKYIDPVNENGDLQLLKEAVRLLQTYLYTQKK